MEASGVGLSASDRPIFNKLQLEAAELSSKFNNNVLDSTKAFKLKISDPSEVEGLPESAKVINLVLSTTMYLIQLYDYRLWLQNKPSLKEIYKLLLLMVPG